MAMQAVQAAGGPEPQPLPVPMAELRAGVIVLSRPLGELWGHIEHCMLPSLQLLARCVCVLVKAVFKWHFCDRIALMRHDGFYQSYEGRVVHVPRGGDLPAQAQGVGQPSAAEVYGPLPSEAVRNTIEYTAALKLTPIFENEDAALPARNHPERQELRRGERGGNVHYVRIPTLVDYQEISAQTVRDYFANAYRIRTTDQDRDVTNTTLVFSPHLRVATPHLIDQIVG